MERLVIGNLIFLLVAMAVIPAMVYVIWQSVRASRGDSAPVPEDRYRERRVLKLVLALALVGGALALLTLDRPAKGPLPSPPQSHDRITTGGQPNSRSFQTAEDLLPWVVVGVCTCLVLLLSAALIQRRRRGFAAEEVDELESPRRELHELVGISIAEIERESDPRRAVIRAYAGMESTLARHALGRRPFEAPGEYLARVFKTLRLSRRPGERLTELFERARFSEHAIGPEMKRESIAALSELRDELEAKPR